MLNRLRPPSIRRRRPRPDELLERRTLPGAAPGTLMVDPEAPPSKLSAFVYDPQTLQDFEEATLDDFADLRDRAGVTWIDVKGLGDETLLTRIGELIGLHSLELEDVVNVHQRPKLERYSEHVFIVTRIVNGLSPVETDQISLIFRPGLVVTFQEKHSGILTPVRVRLREGRRRLRDGGADYLAYALLDAIVDSFFPRLDTLGAELEHLEDLLLQRRHHHDLAVRIQGIRRDLLSLQRVIGPLGEVLGALRREDSNVPVAENTRLYVRDTQDHILQLLDMVAAYRDNASSLMDLQLANVNNRLNEVMKTLTLISAFFIPISFIAGFYGMNFDPDVSPWNMPELSWYFGYPFALMLMGGTSLGLYWYFRHKGWIGEGDGEAGE